MSVQPPYHELQEQHGYRVLSMRLCARAAMASPGAHRRALLQGAIDASATSAELMYAWSRRRFS